MTARAAGTGHRSAARLLAEHAGADERVAKHLLFSEPTADPWVVERLVETACRAGKQGAPESEALFLSRYAVRAEITGRLDERRDEFLIPPRIYDSVRRRTTGAGAKPEWSVD